MKISRALYGMTGMFLVGFLYRNELRLLVETSGVVVQGKSSISSPQPPSDAGGADTTTSTVAVDDGEFIVHHNESFRIAYKLYDVGSSTPSNPFAIIYSCPTTTGNTNSSFYPLAAPFHEEGLLDFTTSISTNLRILTMGDSVGIQFAQSLDFAGGATVENRKVLRYSNPPLHEGMTIAAPVRGGGVLASWRITGWLLRNAEGRPPYQFGGGWYRDDVQLLLNYSYSSGGGGDDSIVQNTTIGSMDALIFRIPTGWIPFSGLKPRVMRQTVDLAHELFGVKVIILVLSPFNNNVPTMEALETFNMLVRSFCESWKPSSDRGVQHVLCLDYNKLTHDLMEMNAISMGMINETDVGDDYMLQRLNPAKKTKWPPSIAHVCAEYPTTDHASCNRTILTNDGAHPCMETIGPRINAALGCILGCVFNQNNGGTTSGFIKECEHECNEKFMQLSPIEERASM